LFLFNEKNDAIDYNSAKLVKWSVSVITSFGSVYLMARGKVWCSHFEFFPYQILKILAKIEICKYRYQCDKTFFALSLTVLQNKLEFVEIFRLV
jgi:hypothetical protein